MPPKKSSRPGVALKTLFYSSTSRAAVLITNRNGRRSETQMQFPSPQSALDWAIANGCTFVFLNGVDSGKN